MNGKWYPQVVIIDMIIGKSVQTKEAAGRLADLPALRPGDYYSMLGNFGKVPGESINSGRTVKLKDFVDSTIDLCLSVFEWAKFRKHKGGIKLHSLYDIEAEVPAFVHITPANIHDSKAMPEIPYEPGAHYVFDRRYNDFSNLYTINRIGAFFVVRAKVNVRIKPKTWKRRLPEGVVSDTIGCFTVYKSSKDYLEELRKLIVEDPENGTRYIFLTNNLYASAELISLLYRNRWSVELFFKWI